MAESGEAALPQAIVVAASQPGNSTALVARPPKLSKEQVKALLAAAPEMFKWSPARVVKLMEFLVKDDEEPFYGRSTWLVERRVVPELSALNQSLRRSTGTLNARVERSVLKGAD